MPPVEEAALENAEASVADVLPEASKSGLPSGDLASIAGEFWKDDPTPAKEETKAETKPDEKKAVVSADDAPPPAKTPLLDRLAAKAKPAEAAKVETKVEAKVESAKVDNPEDKLALDPKSSPKARENFEALRTITKAERQRAEAAERKAADFQAKLDAAGKTPSAANAAELERLRAEHKAMSDKLLLIDTKNHPVFQNQYVKPRAEAISAATELLKAHGKDADLAALIEKPRGEIGKALSEILKDVPAFDQTEISSHVQKAYQLAQSEKQALAQAGEVNGAIRKQDSTTHVKAFDETWSKLAGDFTDIFQPVEIPAGVPESARRGVEEYNAAMASLQDDARKLATGAATYETIAEASIKAAAYERHVKHVLPRIGAEISMMQETIRGLKAEVEGYRSRNPNKAISPNVGGSEKSSTPSTIESAAESAWGG